MDINEATAKAIAAERSAAGLTIKELSEKSGVPERTLIRMLKNERDIKVTQIAQLAEVFGINPHELIEEAERFIARATRNEARERASQNAEDLSEDPDVIGEFGSSREEIDIDAWAERIKAEESAKTR